MIKNVTTIVLEQVNSNFGTKIQQLQDTVKKERQDYAEAILDVYRCVQV